MANIVVELTPQRSDSSLASKSTRSHAPMDVEPLNISYGEKQNESAGKCNHFSIRGYVSEVRKRDPKVCYPFALKDSAQPIELPPMVVPQFRWWQCDGCVPEASVSCGANDKEVQQPETFTDTPLPLVGQPSTDNVPRVRNGEGSTSIDSSDNRNYSPPKVVADPKGKGKAHVEDDPTPSAAWENGFVVDTSQELLQLTTGRIEVTLTTANEDVPGSSRNGNGIINTPQKDSSVEGVEAGAIEEVVNHNHELANEKCGGKPQVSSEGQHEDLPATNVGPEVMEVVHGPSNDSKSRLVNLPDLNECSGEPLNEENNEAIVAGNNVDVFCEDDDDYLGAERRKNPKVRLLSELLGVKETRISAKGRKKNTSLSNSVDENVKRKRITSQDEGSRSMENRISNNGTKKTSGTAENSQTDSDYETDSDDVSIEIISKALAKRRCKPKIPLLEKRNKKAKKDDGGSSLMSRQKILSRSAGHEKGKTSENLPRKHDVTDQLIERSSVLTKKRIPCKNRMSKKLTATQIDEDAEKSPAEKVQKASENLHHFSRSFNIKRNCQVRAPPGADGSSQAEPMLVDDCSVSKHRENRTNSGETSVACRSTVGTPFIKNPLNGNGETSTTAKTILKEKRPRIPEAEEGTPLVQDMPSQVSKPVVNQKELANEVQRRMRDIDINSIPADDKVTEQGPVDDIPMDIVELMAKNQYERHLSDPQEKCNHPAPSGISGKHVRDNEVTNSHGECWQKLGQQPHFLSMQKPPSDGMKSMVNGNLTHVPDFNRNSPSIQGYLPRENSFSARFLSPAQGQELRAPYPPPCGLSLNNWNGTINMAASQRYPPNFLQAMDSYGYRACAPRQNTAEAHHFWPNVVPSCMPLGITNPQMIPQSSNVVKKQGTIHHPSSGSMLNFNASSATAHLGKQQNLDFSNAYSVGHSENSGGSAEYTSDTISAVNLLNLMQTTGKRKEPTRRQSATQMQNAAQMQNTGLSLGPQKVVGPTSSRQPFVENNSRTSAMLDNSHHPCYPTAIPAARPHFTSAFQVNGGSIGQHSNSSFVGPIPLTLRGQRNIGSSHFAHPGVNHQPERQQTGSFGEKGKHIPAISHASYVSSLPAVKDAAPNSSCGVSREAKAISPTPEKIECKLNQNPSEFNDLREWSRYMIGPEDLKPRGMAREKTARPKGNSKRQDVRLNKPIPSGKEREKQRR